MRLSLHGRFAPKIPLIVVGALRSGGSGKTSVTLELVRELIGRGHRPAILAYRLASRAYPKGPGAQAQNNDAALLEVTAEDDWRHSSDEAVLLCRNSGVRVFVTRNRAKAWEQLHHARYHASASFDVLVSDDGFQDPRLAKAFQILLSAPEEKPHLFDLLPAGPFRETWGAQKRADLRLQGPFPFATATPLSEKKRTRGNGPVTVAFFHRRLIFPVDFNRHARWIVFSALGNNRSFLADLEREGILPIAVLSGKNHAAPPLSTLEFYAAKYPDAGILCTEKDILKFAPGSSLPLCPIGQSLSLDAKTVEAVETYLLGFRNRNLVHYPG